MKLRVFSEHNNPNSVTITMDLFPVITRRLDCSSNVSNDPCPEKDLTWLSNNSSFVPKTTKAQPERSQGELLRAAERYLHSSSDEDSEEDAKPPHKATESGKREPYTAQAVLTGEGANPHSDAQQQARVLNNHPGRSTEAAVSHKKHKQDHKSSKSKSSKRHKSSSKAKQRKHDSSEGSDGEEELSKMRKLELKAASRGRPDGISGTGMPRSLPVSGTGTQGLPSYYFDTHGDVQNVLYDKLYAGNVSGGMHAYIMVQLCCLRMAN